MSRPKARKKLTKVKKNKSKSQNLIIAIVLITLAVILFLGLLNTAGLVGNFLGRGLLFLFGWMGWMVPVFFLILAYLFLNYFKIQEKQRKFNIRIFSLFLLFLVCAGLM
ncbi:DNA translocase FtsK 4TM domain-containing protein, partial [bacterium]|nr:DNA translocase FtsK 4TM domain-containing protein [bacterium]